MLNNSQTFDLPAETLNAARHEVLVTLGRDALDSLLSAAVRDYRQSTSSLHWHKVIEAMYALQQCAERERAKKNGMQVFTREVFVS